MLAEYLERLYHPNMEFYRDTYKNSERWDGEDSLDGKRLIIYGEQGFGDVLQFARYISLVKANYDCHITLHCSTPLHRLFLECLHGVDAVLDKEESELPEHDFHTLTMSLPFLLGSVEAPVPYLCCEPLVLEGYEDKFKIGIAWEGNPEHSNNMERNCHLSMFRNISKIGNVALFLVKNEIHLPELVSGCDDIEITGATLENFYDTARLVQAMDLVVSVDTSSLHLAGALGKKSLGLLSKNRDYRWDCGVNWYPSMKLISQKEVGEWEEVQGRMNLFVSMEASKQKLSRQFQHKNEG